jgi:hypothetical protein
MASIKISELPVASSVDDADLIPIVQGGINKQAARSLVRKVFSGAQIRLNSGSPSMVFPSGGPTLAPLDEVVFDTDSYFSAGNPGRLTVPVNGYYQITGHLFYIDANGGGTFRSLTLKQSGVSFPFADNPQGAFLSLGNYHLQINIVLYATAGEYWELYLAHDAGVNFGNYYANGNILQVIKID